MAKYSLVGVDGNAFSLISYTKKALFREGLGALRPEFQEKATSGDYFNLVCVCDEYIDKANVKAIENGYEDYE